MEKLNLEAIPEATRWTIANCLRSAADRYISYTLDAKTLPPDTDFGRRVRQQFTLQAAEALALAEQFENC